MDCQLESLHQLHVNKESAASQFCTRVDAPPFSPTATARSNGQALLGVTKSPAENQKTSQHVDEPSPLEMVEAAKPRASHAFSQLHRYMEERLEMSDPQSVTTTKSALNFDPPPESVKKESEKRKNLSTQQMILLQQQASYKFNSVLVELLELVPRDSIPELLHPVEFRGSSSTVSHGFDVKKYGDGALSDDQKTAIVGNTEEGPYHTPDSTLEYGSVKVGPVPDMTGACQGTAIDSKMKAEPDPSSQTDGVNVLDASVSSQKTAHTSEQREEPDPATDGVATGAFEGLSAGLICGKELEAEEKPELDDPIDGPGVDALTATQENAENSNAGPEPDPANQTDWITFDVLDGLCGNKITTNNSGASFTLHVADQDYGVDVRDTLPVGQNIAEISVAREEPEPDEQTDTVAVDDLDGLSACQITANNLAAKEKPDPADQTHGLGVDALCALTASLKTEHNSGAGEEPEPTDQTDGLAIDVPDAANNSLAREKPDPADQTQVLDSLIASQKITDNSEAREEPDPVDQRGELATDDPDDSFKARQVTANKSIDATKKLEPACENDDVDVVNASTPNQKIANRLEASEEPDSPKSISGFNIRDRILKWESKAKSMLMSDDERRPPNPPGVGKVRKEVRNVVRKSQKSNDETGEGSPEGRPTGCNALRFLFA